MKKKNKVKIKQGMYRGLPCIGWSCGDYGESVWPVYDKKLTMKMFRTKITEIQNYLNEHLKKKV
jgi:hypothetical protein